MNEKIFGDITPVELTFVIIFATLFILTLNFPLTVNILLICGAIYGLISALNKRIRKSRLKIALSKALIIIVPILFVIDTLLTYHAVFNIKIANEANIFVTTLWDTFGLVGGEVFRIAIFLGLMTLIFYMNKSQNEKRRNITCYLLLFMYFMWILVVTSNTIQLIA